MRRPDEKSTPHSPAGPAGDRPLRDKPNAFAAELFEALREREPEPAVPEGAHAGPWHVVELHGGREPLFACQAAGEPGPRVILHEPDLACLAAAALAVTERPPRFRWEHGDDGRLHLLHDGRPVGTARLQAGLQGDGLPLDLTRLADLRARPLPLAQFLVSVPQDVLRRAGTLVMELLREGR